MHLSIFIPFIQLFCILLQPIIPEEKYEENQTFTYQELISEYQDLSNNNSRAKLIERGFSDNGKPIHLFIIDKDEKFYPQKLDVRKKQVILINNGIHAGEACGIDASVALAKRLLNPNDSLSAVLDSVTVLIVPIYNVGGMLNRNSYSRANQNGPLAYGFRGNTKNLDLNRDFIKCDSKNAETFTKLFQFWNPDFFIDTHTTNGSDHQYTLTLIASQKDKLNPVISTLMFEEMIPELYSKMKGKNMDMTPYVYSMFESPDEGIKDFMDSPRYSSGYTSLFNCYSFITEAHVFKPFQARVEHTLGFLESLITYSAANNSALTKNRKEAELTSKEQNVFALNWKLDSNKFETIDFNGYERINKTSGVTEQEMNFYDKERPFRKKINYYNSYQPSISIKKPNYYAFSQAYGDVVDRLEWNGITVLKIENDTVIEVNSYTIEDYKTVATPYEAHYLHYDINVSTNQLKKQFYKGDYLISTDQKNARYLIETMEPQSVDGFFAWNFFDGILQQKEWFSDYAFEPKAKKLLDQDAAFAKAFELKKESDSTFATDNFAQLYFIYKNSPYFEKTVNRFPIYRIE